LSNPFNQLGLLTDAVNKVPGTNDFYDFTFDADLAKTNPKYIYMKDDGSGMPRPEFTEEQNKVAADFLRTQTRNSLDQKTKVDLQAEPSIQYAPNYGGKGSGGGGDDNKDQVTYYEKANNAMRTGNLGALNTTDYSFYFDNKGGKNVMYVASGGNINYEGDQKEKFKPVTNADDLASYLAGIDPKEAQLVYKQGKDQFRDIHGFTLFGAYLPSDSTFDQDKLYSSSTYTDEEREKRTGQSSSKTKPSGGSGASNSGGKPR
jgi:hypothetical protein